MRRLIIFLLLLVSACAREVPRQRPESDFLNTTVPEVRNKIMYMCTDRGLVVFEYSGDQVVCGVPLSGNEPLFKKHMKQHAYTPAPERRIRFVLSQEGTNVNVQAYQWIESPLQYGETVKQDINWGGMFWAVERMLHSIGGEKVTRPQKPLPKRTAYLGKENEWSAHTTWEDIEKTCYVGTNSIMEKYLAIKQSDIFLKVSNIMGKNLPEVSFTSGYRFKHESKVNVTIGDKVFTFFTDGDIAWSNMQDEAVISAMKKAKYFVAEGTRTDGLKFKHKIPLKGFNKAYNMSLQACNMW